VLVSTKTDPLLSMSPAGTLSPVVTAGVGVGVGGGAQALAPAAYPPASTLIPQMPLLITITGDLGATSSATSVPTSSTLGLGLLMLCLAAAALLVFRRRSN